MKESEKKGVVLLMVVGVLVALMAIAVPFAVSMRLAARATINTVADERAAAGAQGASDHATYRLYSGIRARPLRTEGYYTTVSDLSTRLSATLTADLNTTITVDSTAGFPGTGYLAIGREFVGYREKTSTQFGTVANPLIRGAFGSTAATHANGSRVSVYGPDELWDVKVQDEQAKINVNTLSPDGFTRLLNIPAYRHYLDFCAGPSSTQLAAGLWTGDTTVSVSLADGLPARGYVLIDSEWIRYNGISYGINPADPDTLLNARRGYFGTVAADHAINTSVMYYKSPMILAAALPQADLLVSVAGVTLDGLKRAQISASGFLNIGDEWMRYSNFVYDAGTKIATFTIPNAASRGTRGTTAALHGEWSTVYVEPIYFAGNGVDDDPPPGDGRVDEEIENGIDDDGDGLIDEDLEADRSISPYPLPTRLTANLVNTDTSMQVADTFWFGSSGFVVVEGEVIYYAAKGTNQFLTLTRGARNTTAADHPAGAAVCPAGALEIFYSAPFGTVSGIRQIERRSRLLQSLGSADTEMVVESFIPFPLSGVVLVEEERISYAGRSTDAGPPPIYRLTNLTRPNPKWHVRGSIVRHIPGTTERPDFLLKPAVYEILKDYITTASEVGQESIERLILTADANVNATEATLRIDPDRQVAGFGTGVSPGFEGAFPIEPYASILTFTRTTGSTEKRVVTGVRAGTNQGEVTLSWANSGMSALRWGLGLQEAGGLTNSYTPSNSWVTLERKPLSQLNVNTAADPRYPAQLLTENLVVMLALAASENPPVGIGPADAMAVAAQVSRQISVERTGAAVPPKEVQAEGINTKGEFDNVVAHTAGLTLEKRNLVRRYFAKALRLSSRDVYSLRSVALVSDATGDTTAARHRAEIRKVVSQSVRGGGSSGGAASRSLDTQQAFQDWSSASVGLPSGNSRLWQLYPFALDSTSLALATDSADLKPVVMPDAANEAACDETTFLANFDWRTETLGRAADFNPNTGTRGSRGVKAATDSQTLQPFSLLSPSGLKATTDSDAGLPRALRYDTSYRNVDTGSRNVAEQALPSGLQVPTDSVSATMAPIAIEMWIKPSFSGSELNSHTFFDMWPWEDAAQMGAQRDRISISYEPGATSKLVLRVADLITATDSGVTLPPPLFPRDSYAQFEYPIKDTDAFQAGRWYHLAAVAGGSSPGEMMLFLDMVPATSSSLPAPHGAFKFSVPGDSSASALHELTEWDTQRGYAFFFATNHIRWPTLKNAASAGDSTITVKGGGDLGLLEDTGWIWLFGEGVIRYTAIDRANGIFTLQDDLNNDHLVDEDVGIAFKIRNVRANPVPPPNYGQPALGHAVSVVEYSESSPGRNDWACGPGVGRAWHPFPHGAQINARRTDGISDWLVIRAISDSDVLLSKRPQVLKGPSGALPAQVPPTFFVGCQGQWRNSAETVIDNVKITRLDRYRGNLVTNPARWVAVNPGSYTVTLQDATGWPLYGYFILDGQVYSYDGITGGNTLETVTNESDPLSPIPGTPEDGSATLLTFLDIAKVRTGLGEPGVPIGATEIRLDAEPRGFPASGYMRITGGVADELIGYASIRQEGGVWKLISDTALRGAYGTNASAHLPGDRIRAWPIRFWDRYFGAGTGRTNPYAGYFEASARLDGAFVKGFNWEYEESPPANTQVHVFLRLDGRKDNTPSWSDPTTANKADNPGTPTVVELPDTPGLYEFTAPMSPGNHLINQRADEIEIRIYYEYPRALDPAGDAAWRRQLWKSAPKIRRILLELYQPNVTLQARTTPY